MTDGRLRAALAAVAVAGIGVSAYLTAIRLSGGTPECVIGEGCAAVQNSHYAKLAGVPVAALGLAGYAAILVAALWRSPIAPALGLFAALVGAAFSGWLTYAEIALIEEICPWCVVSAGLMLIALTLSLIRALRPPAPASGRALPRRG